MGHTQAIGMADAVRHGAPPAAALQHHLQHNHYPPLPDEAIGIAREAIKRCAAGEPDAEVGTPRGLHPAWRIVQAWHLEPFVDAIGGPPCLECGDLQELDEDGAFCIKCQPSADEMARGVR